MGQQHWNQGAHKTNKHQLNKHLKKAISPSLEDESEWYDAIHDVNSPRFKEIWNLINNRKENREMINEFLALLALWTNQENAKEREQMFKDEMAHAEWRDKRFFDIPTPKPANKKDEDIEKSQLKEQAIYLQVHIDRLEKEAKILDATIAECAARKVVHEAKLREYESAFVDDFIANFKKDPSVVLPSGEIVSMPEDKMNALDVSFDSSTITPSKEMQKYNPELMERINATVMPEGTDPAKTKYSNQSFIISQFQILNAIKLLSAELALIPPTHRKDNDSMRLVINNQKRFTEVMDVTPQMSYTSQQWLIDNKKEHDCRVAKQKNDAAREMALQDLQTVQKQLTAPLHHK